MPRLVDTLSTKSPFAGHNAPIVDIKQGGQFGHMIDYKALVSSTPYVREHVIAVLIQAPRGFDLLPDPQSWYKSLKAIIEEQSREITGLQSTLQIENVEHEIGGAGEKISAVSNVTRSTSEPSHSIPEKYNMPVSLFINSWILELMMDPETKYANIITRGGADVPDHLVDFYSATVLYFEPDPTFRNVLKAWLCTFVRPESEGATIEGSRSLTSGKEDLTIDLRMTATTQVGSGVIELAQKVLNNLRVAVPNPQQRPAMYDDIEAKVKAVNDTGYKEGMDSAESVALQI
jgi:hypothetical protein